MPRVVASIEARMSSSRLPGKVLSDIAGRPALEREVSRLRRCSRVDDVIVATTSNSADDAIAAWARDFGVACHRGSEEDVLQRVVEAQNEMKSDIVVELCGDTPLLDPEIVDLAVSTFLANDCDVVSNTNRLSFPQGLDAQVFPLALLSEVAGSVDDPAVREHVSLHFYEHPERYRIVHLMAPPQWQAPEYRLQLDYPEDRQLIGEIYNRLEPLHGSDFGISEILALLREAPELAEINAHCEEKPVR